MTTKTTCGICNKPLGRGGVRYAGVAYHLRCLKREDPTGAFLAKSRRGRHNPKEISMGKTNIQTFSWKSKGRTPKIGELLTNKKTGQIFKVMDVKVTVLEI